MSLVKYDENYEIDEERISGLSEIFLAVGNVDAFYELQWKHLDEQPISRIVELLNFISSEINNSETAAVLNELADKCASRLNEIRDEELKTLEMSTIEMILRSSNLHLRDEDWLVDLIIKLSRENKKYFCLFEYVFFSNVTASKLEEYVFEFDIEYLSSGMWSSICERLLNRKGKEIPDKRYKGDEFKHEEGHEFYGIMRHLTQETGGNIHNNGTIEIKSNSIFNNSDYYHTTHIVDYEHDNFYHSENKEGVFIQFDFKDREIQLTNYSIQSHGKGPNFGNLRNWKLEVSQDGEFWIPVDEHIEDETLNGSNIIATFNTKPTESFHRFIKLTQTGKSWFKEGKDYLYYFYFPYIEFYGNMRRKI